MNKFNLNELANGATAEQIQNELQKVFENIKDPNTSKVSKRKLTIQMVFTPDKHDEDIVGVDIDVKATLASIIGIGTRFIVDRDNQGNIIAAEWGKELKGQVALEETEEEEHEETEIRAENVIDYQARAK